MKNTLEVIKLEKKLAELEEVQEILTLKLAEIREDIRQNHQEQAEIREKIVGIVLSK